MTNEETSALWCLMSRENTSFIAPSEDGSSVMVTARYPIHPMNHSVEGCVYVDAYSFKQTDGDPNYSHTCFPGKFALHPQHKGTYTCDFAARGYSGRFVIHGRYLGTDNHCTYVSADYRSGVHTFTMTNIALKDYEAKMNGTLVPPIFASEDYLWVRGDSGSHCTIVGFYCIDEKDKDAGAIPN
uniref:Uncharacterized protein n=1 Tax=Pristionchus pacificus TaxID=54126 RepID=A0A8R1UK00_PRIPA